MSDHDTTNAIERLYRRVMLALARARVTSVKDDGYVQVLQVQIGESEVRDETPNMTHYGFAHNPPLGTHFLVSFVGGDRSNGVAHASNNQKFRPKNMKSGEVMVYDKWQNKVYLTEDGIIISSPKKIRHQAPLIEIHATETLKVDCAGNGFHWTRDNRDDYVEGSTGESLPLHPEEIL